MARERVSNEPGSVPRASGRLLQLLPGLGLLSAAVLCQPPFSVPHERRFGIYRLDLASQRVELLNSTNRELQTSALRLNSAGTALAFAQKLDGDSATDWEICIIDTGGRGVRRITNNQVMDLYPAWSPDGARIAFISQRGRDLDIRVVDTAGTADTLLFDSGRHDADIDWRDSHIVFTSAFRVWRMNDDGTHAAALTAPPNAGEWGRANLPAGDYDPRLSPDGLTVVFERLEDTARTHGGYNLFTISVDGSRETRLTNNGYSQGLASWSNSGEQLVYVVAAIGDQGQYHIWQMDQDGSNNRDITPPYFPAGFLCHAPVFGPDDTQIYFIGQWWE